MTQTFTRHLLVKLTPAELEQYGANLAKQELDRNTHVEKHSAVSSDYRKRLNDMGTAIMGLSTVIKAGEESRPVECERRQNFETNTLQVVRLDTGAIIEERALTVEERQVDFFDKTAADMKQLKEPLTGKPRVTKGKGRKGKDEAKAETGEPAEA